MSSDAIHYSGVFGQLSLPLTTVDLHFGQVFNCFLYHQRKLGSSRALNVPKVTTCFIISLFQMLIQINQMRLLRLLNIKCFFIFFHFQDSKTIKIVAHKIAASSH